MAAKKRNLPKQLVVRVDGDLLAHLQRDAEDNGRTVAQTVRFLLRKQMQTPSPAPAEVSTP